MFSPLQAVQDYIRFPSVSTDSQYLSGMAGARDFVAGLLKDMGCTVEIIPTSLHPCVFAYRDGPSHWPHVVIYGHYDVQPPDPLDLWKSPAFEPQIRDGRLYGRGSADNKGPQMAHIAAVARLLEKYPNLPLRITFLIEGEEEIGSPSLQEVLAKVTPRLKTADFILLSDSLSPSPEQIAITVGLRGIVCLNATLTGPKGDLHSGIHGGALLNPIQALTELCASLHDKDGRVNIPGFYDGVIPAQDWERAEVAKLLGSDEEYRKWLDIPAFHTFDGYGAREAVRFLPTLEFNGIGGGYQGEGTKTVIPSKAHVKISCRLVPDMQPSRIQKLVEQTLRERCSSKVKLEIEEGHCGNAYRVVPPDRDDTPKDQNQHLANAFRAADRAINQLWRRPPLYLREGGSVPIIADLKTATGLDSLMIGLFTPECNLHAPNESLHIGLFEKAIDMSAHIMASVAGVE